MELQVDFTSFGNLEALERLELYSDNMEDKNTFSDEYRVVPKAVSVNAPEAGKINEILKPHSWNVLRYRICE